MDKLNIEQINSLARHLYLNKKNIGDVINDYGEILSDNGYGTFFLRPKNPFLKVFWISYLEGEISSVGLGGNELGLKLSDFLLEYKNYNERYVAYDEEYVYTFFYDRPIEFVVKISSPKKVIDKGDILEDIDINGIEITLQNEM